MDAWPASGRSSGGAINAKPEAITRATRAAAYQLVLPTLTSSKERAFEAVRGHGPAGLTAEECHEEIGGSLNNTRSRLTELFKERRLTVVGKRKNAAGTVKIAVYAVPPETRA